MTNSCRDTEAPPFLGVSTPYLLYGHMGLACKHALIGLAQKHVLLGLAHLLV